MVSKAGWSQDRLPPIPDDELSEAQRAAVGELLSGPRTAFGGPFVPLLRSPEKSARHQDKTNNQYGGQG